MKIWTRRITAGLVSTGVIAATVGVGLPASAGASASAGAVRLIVGYKNGGDTSAVANLVSAYGGRSLPGSAQAQQALGLLGAESVQVPASGSALAIASLRSNPNVSYVEVDHLVKKTDVTPNDTYWADQTESRDVNLPAAWDATTGTGVKIAVVDTGVTANADLAGAVSGGYDFVNNDSSPADDEGHGTMVASLIAARGNNGQGIAGGCWACTILPVKVLDSGGYGYDSTVAKGVVYAVNAGAKIINMSLGDSQSSSVLASAVAYANYKGVLVVAAAGNSSTSTKFYPAAYTDVLAVGGTQTGTQSRVSFSNFNSSTSKWVDVAAPGIVTTLDQYGNVAETVEPGHEPIPLVEGTSFSSPIVAGIAGLVKTEHPDWTGWSVQHAITASATPIGSWVTYGEVNAAAAVAYAGNDTTPPTISGVSPGQNARVKGTFTFVPSGVSDGWSGVRSIDLYLNGKWVGYDGTAPWGVNYNTAGHNGYLTFQIRVYDKAGNYKAYNRTVYSDNLKPTVRITKAPKNKSKVKGTISVYYTGADKYDGVAKYQLLVNGKVSQTHTTAAHPFTVTTSKWPKNFTVQIRVYDKAGNYSYSSKLSYHR